MPNPSPTDASLPSSPNDHSTPAAKRQLGITVKRFIAAAIIAALSDAFCAFIVIAPPLVWAIDILTAVLLFIVLGWHWLLLPGLIMEAIPGLGVIPIWLLVVAAIAVFGTARPQLKSKISTEERPR